MSLPFIPGNNFDNTVGREKFHKSQLFDYRNDVPAFVGESKTGIGGEILPGYRPKNNTSSFPKGEGAPAPAWVAFDRKVLSFKGYFKEDVVEKREETFRIRKCIILFYLEDDTIQVNERQVENSGIPQGTLIRRHRIPLQAPYDNKFYTVEQFNVGKTLAFYSKSFRLIDCDSFTKKFLEHLGVKVGEAEEFPDDPYEQFRADLLANMQPLRPYEKVDVLKQFLEFDRRVLRFYGVWDDRNSLFGDIRELVLHYFLADGTIEIKEIVPPNSGRDAAPIFLRRQRLPKSPEAMEQPGVRTKRTVLNVFGPMGHGGRYILDSLKTGAVHQDYYHDSDLCIGAILDVWGRKVLICDCDSFTKAYYRSKYELEKFEPILYHAPAPPIPPTEIPPYEGFQIGSEEDSRQNCISLIPKPPKQDFQKFMEKDKQGLDSNVLRYMASLDTEKAIDADRRFIVSYYLSDNTLSVYEPLVRNSGIIGGKFIERGKILKDAGLDVETQRRVYYEPQDLYIGAGVSLNRHNFILIDADEYAISYMENRPDEFPIANIEKIKSKLSQLDKDQIQQSLTNIDHDSKGKLTFDKFFSTIKNSTNLIDHEIVTLARYYGGQLETNKDEIAQVVNKVQATLKESRYEAFPHIALDCKLEDSRKSGFIALNILADICTKHSLPLSPELFEKLIRCVDRNTQNKLDYQQFVTFVNWRDSPAKTLFSTRKSDLGLKPAGSGSWPQYDNDEQYSYEVDFTRMLSDVY
ncbi:hypothetical protein LOD99_8851 [Oopsacas minuta]|uniref:EF-hand domain-containing family member C2 n=1 Tax=Oopsacas minuta TaxID=111878 RepID=A0AAV7JE60_9METZ|nr:hypothetical protein LOD99_8851 [Oopsacas minuta]